MLIRWLHFLSQAALAATLQPLSIKPTPVISLPQAPPVQLNSPSPTMATYKSMVDTQHLLPLPPMQQHHRRLPCLTKRVPSVCKDLSIVASLLVLTTGALVREISMLTTPPLIFLSEEPQLLLPNSLLPMSLAAHQLRVSLELGIMLPI